MQPTASAKSLVAMQQQLIKTVVSDDNEEKYDIHYLYRINKGTAMASTAASNDEQLTFDPIIWTYLPFQC